MFRKATLLVLLALAIPIQAQETNKRPKHRYVIVRIGESRRELGSSQ
jgi:hypothetical protein